MRNWIIPVGGIIAATLILRAVAYKAAGTLISGFWGNRMLSMEQTVKRVRSMGNGTVCGAKMFMQKTSNGVKEIIRVYTRVGEQWEEMTISKIISETELPAEVSAILSYSEETDITDMLKAHLDVKEEDIANILEGQPSPENGKE